LRDGRVCLLNAGMAQTSHLTGGYAERGEYHRTLDPNWAHYPTYMAKRRLVRRWMASLPPESRILDAGRGEGVLVEEFAAEGRAITGLDINCESELIRRGSLTAMPFDDAFFDAVTCLDVLEHLPLSEQRLALAEILRVVKPGGKALITVPNLNHLANRFRFLLRGAPQRTAKKAKHPGGRPAPEWERMIGRSGLEIIRCRGIFPTVPWLWRWVRKRPAKRAWMHDLLSRSLPVPGWAFCFVVEARRPAEADR